MAAEINKRAQFLAYSAALAAVLFSSAMVAAKMWAWLASGSAAMLSSMIDSSVDVIMSFTNFLALRYAFQPADEDHRYGHGKAEGIAALGQATFIVVSCGFLVMEAVDRLGHPHQIEAVNLSVMVLLCATLATIALTTYQRYVAKRTNSLAVEADGRHYTSDMAMNLSIIVSLIVGQQYELVWLDPVVALMVAAWLLWNARGITLKALDMLLDREAPDHVRLMIKKEIMETAGVESLHDLRTRRSGPHLLISFDIEVDPDLSLKDAHEISRRVEERVQASVHDEFPYTEVMIHIDPRGDTADSRHKKMKDFHAH